MAQCNNDQSVVEAQEGAKDHLQADLRPASILQINPSRQQTPDTETEKDWAMPQVCKESPQTSQI